MKKILLLVVSLILIACGKENPSFLNITVQLPAHLSKSSGRYEAFLKTVEFMKVTAERGGEKKEYVFPPIKWENLLISDLPPTKGKDSKVEISIEVWDHQENGFRRTYPILVGKGSTSSHALKISLKQR